MQRGCRGDAELRGGSCRADPLCIPSASPLHPLCIPSPPLCCASRAARGCRGDAEGRRGDAEGMLRGGEGMQRGGEGMQRGGRRSTTCTAADVCACVLAGIEARAGPAAAPLAGGGATANMATVAAAERASRPRSAEGMLLPVALGDPSRGATLPPCRNSGDGGSGCATTVVTAARSRPPDAARREYRQTPSEPRAPPHCPPRHNSGSSAAQRDAGPPAGARWIGLCRATPALPHSSGGGST